MSKESVRTLPSYFERAKNEPELLVKALKRKENNQKIKTMILDSFTLRRYKQTNGDARQVHIPPIRDKLVDEVLSLLSQMQVHEHDSQPQVLEKELEA